jgi:hypothetical protein
LSYDYLFILFYVLRANFFFAVAKVDTSSALEVSSAGQACGLLEGAGGLTFEEALEVHKNLTSLPDSVARPGAAEALAKSSFLGRAVLVQRGGCSFIDKAKAVQAAGGAAVIIVNSHTGLSRFGVEPRWKGLGVRLHTRLQ